MTALQRAKSFVPETTDRQSTSARKTNWIAHILLLLVLFGIPLVARNFVIFQMTMLIVYAIGVLALNVLTGASGQFSLGQSAFYAIGAYTTAVLITQFDINYAATLPVAGVVSFAAGLLLGLPAIRLSGMFLGLATFSLSIAVPQVLKMHAIESWTGGVQGLSVGRARPLFGLAIPQNVWLYYFTLVIAVVVYFLCVNLLRSRSGRALMAIRDNDIAAAAMGIKVARYKALIFGITAGITGIAGGLSALAVQFVSPDSYTVQLAIALFMAIVVGGVGWLPGSLAGAAFILFVPNIAESLSKGLTGAVFGIILIIMLFFLPNGLAQVVKRAGSIGMRTSNPTSPGI